MQKTAQIALIGLSYKTAPLAVREQLSIGVCRIGEHGQVGEHRDEVLADLPQPLYRSSGRCAWLQEWAVLSTCNRIELYAAVDAEVGGFPHFNGHDMRKLEGLRYGNGDDGDGGELRKLESLRYGDSDDGDGGELRKLESLRYGNGDSDGVDTRAWLVAMLAGITGVKPAVFNDYAYFYQDEQAAGHLLRVASGLESQVLGEPQILGQVTHAYTTATKEKSIGPVLGEVFRAAIRSGKRARTDTAISQNSVGLSSLAIAQAQGAVGDLAEKKYLVVGLGEMGRLAFKQLQARGVKEIGLVNRTHERALQMGHRFGQPVYRWQDLTAALSASDVVISATGAPNVVITADQVREVMSARQNRPLYLLDIAVPRDIDAAIKDWPGVTLWDADELRGSLDEALAAREMEVPRVEAIITEEMERLAARLRMLAVKPVVVRLRQKAEEIRRQEFERALNHLGEIDAQTLEQIQFLSRSLVRKLLHEPTVRLKDKASEDDAALYAAALSDLFDLNE